MAAGSEIKRRRADGERSRRTILLTAAKLATVEGLDGLSIGRLAEASGISKGGLYAHFGSKEELQLATIGTAWAIFEEEVVAKGMAAPPGRERIIALSDAFLDHLRAGVFPGGCFFASAAAEFDTRPGRVMQEIAEFIRGWSALIASAVVEARDRGELSADTDTEQLTFEIGSLLIGANSGYLLEGESVLERARRGVERLLAVS
jgi:AcrR family transcriptional regulator